MLASERLLLGSVHTQSGHFCGKGGKSGLPALQLLAFAVNQVVIGQIAQLACPLGDMGGYPFLLAGLFHLSIRDDRRGRNNDQDNAEQEHGDDELRSKSHEFSSALKSCNPILLYSPLPVLRPGVHRYRENLRNRGSVFLRSGYGLSSIGLHPSWPQRESVQARA